MTVDDTLSGANPNYKSIHHQPYTINLEFVKPKPPPMKLWQKDGSTVNEIIEKFTVGRDKEFDILLAAYDVEGSMAHAAMLESIGMISKEEAVSIQKALGNMLTDIREGRFQIEPGVEDVHSQVEFNLTKAIGEAGKKFTAAAAGMIRWPLTLNSSFAPKFKTLKRKQRVCLTC